MSYYRIIKVSLFLLAIMWSYGPVSTATANPANHWVNSIGSKYLPVPGTDIQMCIWETRVRDFSAFVNETGYDASKGFYYHKNWSWRQDEHYWKDPGFQQTDDHPVIGVSWRDGVAFCEWLTEKERASGVISRNKAYRLPTDEEWTLAAGADSPPYGKNFGNYHTALELDPFEYTSPVGTFAPNEFGFYDMAGNAWEFCLDLFNNNPEFRILRGGCWQNWHGKYVGVKARGRSGRDIRISLYGFRVVLAEDNEFTENMRTGAIIVETPSDDDVEF